MMAWSRRFFCAALIGAAMVVAAPAAMAKDMLVFAAASLKNALDDASAAYEKQTGEKVVVSYAGSSALAKQIENGAPADLFISADLAWMDYLQERKAIRSDTRLNLLSNSIVLIAPQDDAAPIEVRPGYDILGRLGDGRLAMAEPNSVPAGKYGKAALESLGVWTSVENRVAAAENVRAALALVARGEAPLGIVYETDAKAEPGVRIVGRFDAGTHPPIIYPAALTAQTGNQRSAAGFLAFLSSAAAAPIFEKHGFTVAARAS